MRSRGKNFPIVCLPFFLFLWNGTLSLKCQLAWTKIPVTVIKNMQKQNARYSTADYFSRAMGEILWCLFFSFVTQLYNQKVLSMSFTLTMVVYYLNNFRWCDWFFSCNCFSNLLSAKYFNTLCYIYNILSYFYLL